MTTVFFMPRRTVSDAVAYAWVLLVGMVRKKYPPLRPSSVKGLAVEQQVICTTFDGAVTAEMIGPVTPEEMVPVNAGTRSTSTRYLAASTPTVGCPWSSRRMNCTGQPLTPPPWLTSARAKEQHEHQEQADQDDLDRGALRGMARRHQLGDRDPGARPDGPDDQRAEQGAPVIAAAAHDEHGPDLEGDDRQEIERADEADEADVERAGQPHERRA